MNKITRLLHVKFNQVSVVWFCLIAFSALELFLKEEEAYKITIQILTISTFQFYISCLGRYGKEKGIRVKDTN